MTSPLLVIPPTSLAPRSGLPEAGSRVVASRFDIGRVVSPSPLLATSPTLASSRSDQCEIGSRVATAQIDFGSAVFTLRSEEVSVAVVSAKKHGDSAIEILDERFDDSLASFKLLRDSVSILEESLDAANERIRLFLVAVADAVWHLSKLLDEKLGELVLCVDHLGQIMADSHGEIDNRCSEPCGQLLGVLSASHELVVSSGSFPEMLETRFVGELTGKVRFRRGSLVEDQNRLDMIEEVGAQADMMQRGNNVATELVSLSQRVDEISLHVGHSSQGSHVTPSTKDQNVLQTQFR